MQDIPEDFENFSNEVEEEYSRRLSELGKIENTFKLSENDDDDLAGLLRNAMVVMLYAYFEGFCKKVFEIYILYINRSNENVSRIKSALAASTISKEFDRLENTNYAPPVVGIDYKEDGKLKRHARRIEFVEAFCTIMAKRIDVPESVANTESNLKPDVLKRILYNLALNYQIIDCERGNLHKLLCYRNDIAHGTFVRPISEDTYHNLKKATYQLMILIKDEVIRGYQVRSYLR